MSSIESPERYQELPASVIKNMIALATSGFGVVVALAWNSAIQGFVREYIDPYLGPSSGIVSLFIYAIIVTVLAVVVSMQLSMIQKRIEKYQGKNEEDED